MDLSVVVFIKLAASGDKLGLDGASAANTGRSTATPPPALTLAPNAPAARRSRRSRGAAAAGATPKQGSTFFTLAIGTSIRHCCRHNYPGLLSAHLRVCRHIYPSVHLSVAAHLFARNKCFRRSRNAAARNKCFRARKENSCSHSSVACVELQDLSVDALLCCHVVHQVPQLASTRLVIGNAWATCARRTGTRHV